MNGAYLQKRLVISKLWLIGKFYLLVVIFYLYNSHPTSEIYFLESWLWLWPKHCPDIFQACLICVSSLSRSICQECGSTLFFYGKPFLNSTKLSSLINLENHENLFKSDLLFQSCDHHVNKITQLDRWKSRIIILVISSILMLTSDISWLRNELFVASCQSLFQYLKASKVCF